MTTMVKTAGMVQGTPDWQLDLMYAQESSDLWKQLNTETDGETLRQAAKSLGYAINELDEACDCVNEAAEALTDTAEGDKMLSILDEMEKILDELKSYRAMWGSC